jgi:hypothetical protein
VLNEVFDEDENVIPLDDDCNILPNIILDLDNIYDEDE